MNDQQGQDEAVVNARTTELRVALVCYGGVSLAIYMHGVTKELHKLLVAARAFDEMPDLDGMNPFAKQAKVATEAAYFEALRTVAKDTGRRLSVSIDIIAGASAGGINGVVLAKAIARNAQQETLKQLWIEEGDLKKLLRGPRIGGLVGTAVLATVKQLFHLGKQTSPLRGERMSQLLVRALDDMDESGSDASSLMPPLGQLELFVTATDLYGFTVLVPSGSGGASQRDRSHEQVLEFRAHAGDTSGFGPDLNPALAFSARATSSFPGAFAPVNVRSFETESGRSWTPPNDLFRYQYEENNQRAQDAWFVDGGTLNNSPFDLVVEAIAKRPADTEVLRQIVYIQPDPGRPLGDMPDAPSPDVPPREAEGYLASLWDALGGARTSHPILPDLLRIRDINWRVAQIGAITKQQMDEVLAQIGAASKEIGLTPNRPTDPLTDEAGRGRGDERAETAELRRLDAIKSKEQVEALSREMHKRVADSLGPAYPTYQRLKVEAAARRLADEVSRRFVSPLTRDGRASSGPR